MNPQTFSINFNDGKVIPIQCVKDDTINDLEIENICFLLMIIYEGSAYFQVGGTSFEAVGPCFVCFDETETPKLIRKNALKCDSIYFNPTFLNINMTFSKMRCGNYEQLALMHDMFLLKPFTDNSRYVYPAFEYVDNMRRL